MFHLIQSFRQWLRLLALTFGFLFFILLSIPVILDSNAVQKAISGSISATVIQGVKPDKVTFSFFPYPSIILSDITVTIPSVPKGKIKNIFIYFSPYELIRGKIIIKKITIQNPAIYLSDSLASSSFNKYNLFDKFTKDQGDFPIEISNIVSDSFKSADALIFISPSGKDLSGSLTINNLALSDSVKSNLSNKIKTCFPIPSCSASRLNVEFMFKSSDNFKIDLDFAEPLIRFDGTQQPTINSNKIICNMVMAKKKFTTLITDIEINSFASSLALEFEYDKDDSKASLMISGNNINMDTIRPEVIRILPQNVISNTIFNIIQGGIVKNIKVLFPKNDFYFSNNQIIKKFFNPFKMGIYGEIENGTINIPGTHLTTTKTGGVATVKNGILNVQISKSNIGISKINNGMLDVNLLNGSNDFKGEFDIEADLSHLNTVLKELLPKTPVARELAMLSDIHGEASGTLKLKGNKHHPPSINVSTRDIKLKGNYKRLPRGFFVNSGEFEYHDDMVIVSRISGRVGQSIFSNISASLTLDGNHLLGIKSGKAEIVLEEVLPWLNALNNGISYTQQEDYSKSKPKAPHILFSTTSILANISSIFSNIVNSTGKIYLKEVVFKGSLIDPLTWDYLFEGKGDKVALRQKPNQDEISDISAVFLLSPLMTRISINNASIKKTALISALMNSENAGNIVNPNKILNDIRIPFNITDFDFQQKASINEARESTIDISCNFIFSKNIQLSWTQKTTDYSKTMTSITENIKASAMKIKSKKDYGSANSHKIKIFNKGVESASIVYDKQKQPYIEFTGTIDTQTVLTLFNPMSETYKAITSLTGNRNISIESSNNAHYTISTAELDLNFILEKQKLMRQKEGNILIPILSLNKASSTSSKSALPIFITLNCDRFIHKKINISPFSARIEFNGDDKKITIEKMNLCNINGSAKITIDKNRIEIFITLDDKNKNIEPVLACLYDGKRLMQGKYSLKATLHSQATLINSDNNNEIMDSLKKNLAGTIEMRSEGGRIFRLTLLSRILSVINIAKLMKGKLPDIEQNGFAFNSIKFMADVVKGKIILKQAVINGLDMTLLFVGEISPFTSKIDLTCLVAPFKTADSIIKKIPIINTMLRGRLISVPVKAGGTINDPDITVLHPSEVAKSIIYTMQDILTTPFRLINLIQ